MPTKVFTSFVFRVRYIFSQFITHIHICLKSVYNSHIFSFYYIGVLQQEIAHVADVVLRRYYNTIPYKDKRPKVAAHAMMVGVKEKTLKLYIKMIKLLIVVNPTYWAEFLKEVSIDILRTIL